MELTLPWVCIQFGCFWTNGQICSSTSRLLVHESIADRFYAHLKKRAESVMVCDPMKPESRLGPAVNELQYAKVQGFIKVRTPSTAPFLFMDGSVASAYICTMFEICDQGLTA